MTAYLDKLEHCNLPSITRKMPSKSERWYGNNLSRATWRSGVVEAIIICRTALILSSEAKNWKRDKMNQLGPRIVQRLQGSLSLEGKFRHVDVSYNIKNTTS